MCRPNIFLDCKEFDEVKFVQDCVDALKTNRKAPRHLVYTRTKEDASRLARAVARAIGQYDNILGVQLVNVVHGDLSAQAQRDKTDDIYADDDDTRFSGGIRTTDYCLLTCVDYV